MPVRGGGVLTRPDPPPRTQAAGGGAGRGRADARRGPRGRVAGGRVGGGRVAGDRIHPAVAALAVLGIAFFATPIVGLAWKVPWGRLGSLVSAPETIDALVLSVGCSLAATFWAVLLGLPVAWVLATGESPARRLGRGLITLTLVLPPVVGGVVLLVAFGRHGLVGQWLDRWFDLRLPFSTAGVVLAQTFVAAPFFIITADAALRSDGGAHEEAAATLGAGRWDTFRCVTLPRIGPSLLAGMVLSWARALGEFGATVTFAGNLPSRTRTLPLALYSALDVDPDAALALGLLQLGLCGVVLFALRDRWLFSSTPR